MNCLPRFRPGSAVDEADYWPASPAMVEGGRAAAASASMRGVSPAGGPSASAVGLTPMPSASMPAEGLKEVWRHITLLLASEALPGSPLPRTLASPALLLPIVLRGWTARLLACLAGVHAANAGGAAAAPRALAAAGRLLVAWRSSGRGWPPSCTLAACKPSCFMRLPRGAEPAGGLGTAEARTGTAWLEAARARRSAGMSALLVLLLIPPPSSEPLVASAIGTCACAGAGKLAASTDATGGLATAVRLLPALPPPLVLVPSWAAASMAACTALACAAVRQLLQLRAGLAVRPKLAPLLAVLHALPGPPLAPARAAVAEKLCSEAVAALIASEPPRERERSLAALCRRCCHSRSFSCSRSPRSPGWLPASAEAWSSRLLASFESNQSSVHGRRNATRRVARSHACAGHSPFSSGVCSPLLLGLCWRNRSCRGESRREGDG